MKKRKGFTLVELVIVIAVIAILAAVLIPTFAGILERARESSRIQQVTSARNEFLSSNKNIVSISEMEGYIFSIDNKLYTIENGKVVIADDSIDIENDYSISNVKTSNSNISIYIPNAKTETETIIGGFYDLEDNLICSWDDAIANNFIYVNKTTLTGLNNSAIAQEYVLKIDSSIKTISMSMTSNSYCKKLIVPNDIFIDYMYIDANLEYNVFNNINYIGNDSNPYLIATGVTDINLEEITLHENCIGVNNMAFSDMVNLKTANLNNNLKFLSYGIFLYCSSLETLYLPENIEHIDREVFIGCDSLGLKDDGIVYIGTKNNPYFYASSVDTSNEISELTFNSNTAIISSNFLEWSNSVTKITIPANIKHIGTEAFGRCMSLETVIFEEGCQIKELPFGLFNCCENLTSIEIPTSVETIGDAVFCYCTSIEELIIPSSVKHLGVNAVTRMTSLKNIVIPSSVVSIGLDCFDGLTCEVIFENPTLTRFEGCFGNYQGTSITIPKTIEYIDGSTFYACTNLTEIKIEDGNKNFVVVNNGLYGKGMLIKYISSDETSFQIESSVTIDGLNYQITTIEKFAFSFSKNLTTVIIPSGFTKISQQAFYVSTSVTTIYIPATIVEIGNNVFYSTSNLENIYYAGTQTDFETILGNNLNQITKVTKHYNYTY